MSSTRTMVRYFVVAGNIYIIFAVILLTEEKKIVLKVNASNSEK